MRQISLLEYDSNWPKQYRVEAELLASIFSPMLANIHHIGSTSVPGLMAKPVIDILLEVMDILRVDNLNDKMKGAGYKARGENGIFGRRYFQKGNGIRTHHLHVFERGHPEIHKHLAFRDYLRKHADIATRYAALKQQIARACHNDSAQYSAAKHDFIQYHTTLALKESTNPSASERL
ncbi:hypothetical protein LMG33818_000436 [Halomonadaceae bacterium LMG 33818]|uniref:GrpB family protein n=1 Tax=Cernens ardua TaxID=3402176 RepID=UPI003EDB8D37